jgi:hypothetical protein
MNSMKRGLGLLTVSVSVLIMSVTNPPGAAHAQTADHSSTTNGDETTQAKWARIVDTGAHGTVVLREGNNEFTCMPGSPQAVGEPPMCADAEAMQWSADFKAHKAKPTNTEPGIIYMLAGATQRSDTDPYDTTSQPIPIGPHWMIMWPFDPKTSGLPTTHKPTGAYIMWAGSPYAHLHVMGRP